jgi:hypothetical protein
LNVAAAAVDLALFEVIANPEVIDQMSEVREVEVNRLDGRTVNSLHAVCQHRTNQMIPSSSSIF